MSVFSSGSGGGPVFPPSEQRFQCREIIRLSGKKTLLRMKPSENGEGISSQTLDRLNVLSNPEERFSDSEGTEIVLRVSAEIVPFLAIFALIDSYMSVHNRAILAIDGPSASGKTTLSRWLSAVYGCETIHMDDYFLPRERAVPDRLAEVGGNIDYERFIQEVVFPLRKFLPLNLRKFDCQTQTLSNPVALAPTRLLVVEGVYSLHPKFRSVYDLSVFLDVSAPKKIFRVIRRNRFSFGRTWKHLTRWIPLENRYFRAESLRNLTHLSLRT
jgi:uridine kinase